MGEGGRGYFAGTAAWGCTLCCEGAYPLPAFVVTKICSSTWFQGSHSRLRIVLHLQKLKSLRNHCLELDWYKPTDDQIVKRLSVIAAREGIKVSEASCVQE
jgi:hypothetical protein